MAQQIYLSQSPAILSGHKLNRSYSLANPLLIALTLQQESSEKLKSLIDFIVKHSVFGETRYRLYSVEWQKRELPHAHARRATGCIL